MSRLGAFCIGVVAAAHVAAQDLDTAVFPQGRKPVTILDQIQDRRERNAFLRLYRERHSGKRRSMAEDFLHAWPESWLLVEVYEIACKASIDLEDYPAALQYGKLSLQLLPENPLLLAPFANVQAKTGLHADAVRSASEALEYLSRFGRPASIGEAKWPALERELKASSYYVLARVAAFEGLGAKGGDRRAALRTAQQHLKRARQLNAADPDIPYLLTLVERAMQKAHAGELAAADPISEPAPKSSHLPEYAGSQVCRSCHASQHLAWEQTGMARMLRPYQPENVIGEFRKDTQFQGEAGRPVARMWMEKDRRYFAIKGPGTEWQSYPVDYTIGSKWQQAYATRLANGEIHVLPLQYNRLEKIWLNYWKLIDPPGSARTDIAGFHRMSRGTNYQINCAPCHTSQLRSKRGGGLKPPDLEFREPGINCEMCHGPSAMHVTAMSAGKAYDKQPIDPPVDFHTLDHRKYVEICAQCHAQSAMRDSAFEGEWNYSTEGMSFVRTYPSRPFVEFSRRAFYKDGRFRETTFIAEALMRSACYRRGQAHCGNCHDAHPADAASNPTSLKYRDQPDRMCLQCHAGYAARIEAHTHHVRTSEGSRCLNCHMPRIMNSVLFLARTHQIDDIPRADMTLRFGQQESPNACLLCHGEKDGQWVLERLSAW
jgi:predicted CXXCH cytochrome family protein